MQTNSMLFNFIIYRISMAFAFLFIYGASHHKSKNWVTALVLLGSYLLSSLIDGLGSFVFDQRFYALVSIAQSATAVIAACLVSKNKGGKDIFIGFLSLCIVAPANLLSFVCFSFTLDFFSGIVVAIAVNTMVILALDRFFISDFLGYLDEFSFGWKSFCFVPIIFYIIIIVLSIFPRPLTINKGNAVSIILIYILMIVVYASIRQMVHSHYRTVKEKNVDFLISYSDRLKDEMHKIQVMYQDMDNLKLHVQKISRQIIDNIEDGSFEEAKRLVEKLSEKRSGNQKIKLSKNITVNSVIIRCEQEAELKDVNFSYNLSIPENLGKINFQYAEVMGKFLTKAIDFASESELKNVNLAMYYAGNSQIFEIRTSIPERMDSEFFAREFKEIFHQAEVAEFIKNSSAGYNLTTHNTTIIVEVMVKV